jgi:hypothetical protein
MHTVDARPENRRRDTRCTQWHDTPSWVRSEAFAEDLDETLAPAVPVPARARHNPRPDRKGSDVVLEPIRRAAGRGFAGLFGGGLGGARA